MIYNNIELSFSIFFFIVLYLIYSFIIFTGKYEKYAVENIISLVVFIVLIILFFLSSYFINIFLENMDE